MQLARCLTKPESYLKLFAHLACIGVAVRGHVRSPGQKIRKKWGEALPGGPTPKMWVTPENALFSIVRSKIRVFGNINFFHYYDPFGTEFLRLDGSLHGNDTTKVQICPPVSQELRKLGG